MAFPTRNSGLGQFSSLSPLVANPLKNANLIVFVVLPSLKTGKGAMPKGTCFKSLLGEAVQKFAQAVDGFKTELFLP